MKRVLLKLNDKYRGYYSIFGVLIPITKKYTYKIQVWNQYY